MSIVSSVVISRPNWIEGSVAAMVVAGNNQHPGAQTRVWKSTTKES